LIFRVATLFIHNKNNYDVLLVVGVLTNVIVGITIGSALPWVRNTHHKSASLLLLIFNYTDISSLASSNGTIDLWDGKDMESFSFLILI